MTEVIKDEKSIKIDGDDILIERNVVEKFEAREILNNFDALKQHQQKLKENMDEAKEQEEFFKEKIHKVKEIREKQIEEQKEEVEKATNE